MKNHRNRSAKNAHTLKKGYGWGHKKDAKKAASKLERKGGKFLTQATINGEDV